MEYLIIGLAILAIWHWLWEGILAPSFRRELRYRLFALRDELRRIRYSHGDVCPPRCYNHLQDLINTAINRMHRFDAWALADAYRTFEKDERLRKEVNSRIKRFETELKQCELDELREINKKAVKVFLEALVINSGGWFVFILPPIFIWNFYRKLTEIARDLLFTPEYAEKKFVADQAYNHY